MTPDEILADFRGKHRVFVTLSKTMMARQNAHGHLIETVLLMLTACLPADERRDFVNQLYEHRWPEDVGDGATDQEREDAAELARQSNDHYHRLVDALVTRLADGEMKK
jgi:hypothetical protein